MIDGQGGSTAATNTFNITPTTSGPRLTGTPALLPNGRESTPYLLKSEDLLQGFSDTNQDPLFITDLKASSGTLSNNNNGTWTLIGDDNINGTINLTYNISDGTGNYLAASNSFMLAPVNDAPALTSEPSTLLGAIQNDEYIIYDNDLLKGFTDPEGDSLSAINVRASRGSIVKSVNQTWIYTPETDDTGNILISYSINDGQGNSISATNGFTLQPINSAPRQSTNNTSLKINQQASNQLARASESVYIIQEKDLLQGYSDPDGDTLSIDSLHASSGSLKRGDAGTWIYTTKDSSTEPIQLSYDITDGRGGTAFASKIVFPSPRNRQPRENANPAANSAKAKLNPEPQAGNNTNPRANNDTHAAMVLQGDHKKNQLRGSHGDDDITGHGGRDKLFGQGGHDWMDGGKGKDRLKGGPGNDELIGGTGKDKLWGQDGRDRFVLTRGVGYDVIADFTSGQDLIEVPGAPERLLILSRRDDALIYEGDDLLARVNNAADDLQSNGNILM